MKYFSFLFKKWPLFIVIALTGLVASFLEGLGIVIIFPILEGIQNSIAKVAFPFNLFSNFFEGWGLPQRLQIAAVLLITITVLKGSAMYANTILSCRLQMITIKHFRMLCFNQLMRAGIGYFNNQKKSDLQTICNIYTLNLGSLVNMIATTLPNIFNIIVLIAMLFILSWKMTLVSLVLVSFASFALKVLSHKANAVGRLCNQALKSSNSLVLDVLTGMKTIRIFGREKETIHHLKVETDYYNESVFRAAAVRGATKPVFEAMTTCCLALMLITGSFFVVGSSGINLPQLLLFLVILYRIVNPVMNINQMRIHISVDLPAYREVFNFLNPQDKQHLVNGKNDFSGLKKAIEFRKVKFGYNPDEAIIFENVFLSIPKGSKAGIVGLSGVGKSTLIELLMRFYDPQAGSILVDGVDLREMDIHSWRKNIGVVSQDTFLFNDTIKANITFARPDATKKMLETAATKAHAHEFINSFPKKYDTLIGDRGVLLSGGQRQRIAIARAVIIDPDILIFDEATSSLDSESEGIVQEAFDEASIGKTVITIAHRLSTIYNSDMIFVVDSGVIAESGTHKDLLKKDGIYKKLVDMQELGSSAIFSEFNAGR